ncbi:inosine-5'-monophosphate dehydrogenase [Streptomyces amritsarensis]|uniref:Inosine-5'-monophosphate dehydrogenase n=1 Tax=Streptomyces amritsarensis TaxID=681158 RepID=A0ABX3G127_9ACTN|nr:CBS domain-containing protein [Streptomyces amritsarensis]OLZ62745.1 inosine-5'-monophosphate dehydrogenase [Streptomyces amritsarensis]
MRHREVGELMTRDVVTVAGQATFKDVIRTLDEHKVSAVAVTDPAGHPLGVISEGDLLPKPADQGDWFRSLPHPERWESEKAAGTKAEELMSAPPVCARPDWTVAEAARLMESQRVKRLLVVDDADVLVGIVTRGDLLRIFLRDDDAIRHEITGDVLDRTLHLDPAAVTVDVVDGKVTLNGVVRFRSLIPAVERLCRTVDGVVSVTDRLAWETDDIDTRR